VFGWKKPKRIYVRTRSKHHKENHVNTRHWMRVLKGLILKSLYMIGAVITTFLLNVIVNLS
ncbi:hypothetical protein KKI90_19185, partial [Xenorhabdus bovienii]|uniref:hypothetical protein n=1 Tax=Xenorhabdus bovienii TaxID=40576 RepID=UPI00237C72B2